MRSNPRRTPGSPGPKARTFLRTRSAARRRGAATAQTSPRGPPRSAACPAASAPRAPTAPPAPPRTRWHCRPPPLARSVPRARSTMTPTRPPRATPAAPAPTPAPDAPPAPAVTLDNTRMPLGAPSVLNVLLASTTRRPRARRHRLAWTVDRGNTRMQRVGAPTAFTAWLGHKQRMLKVSTWACS
jgi:hypothetical protein